MIGINGKPYMTAAEVDGIVGCDTEERLWPEPLPAGWLDAVFFDADILQEYRGRLFAQVVLLELRKLIDNDYKFISSKVTSVEQIGEV